MKHLLNDLSDSEKNRILEQYENSILVETKNFYRLLGAKSGNVKPLINEREGEHIMGQHLRQTDSPYQDYWYEFPFPKDGSEEELPFHKEVDEEDEYLMELDIDEDDYSDTY
jgi:hypothetical protein